MFIIIDENLVLWNIEVKLSLMSSMIYFCKINLVFYIPQLLKFIFTSFK